MQVTSRTPVAAGTSDVVETGFVHRTRRIPRGHGVAAEWDVLHGGNRVDALVTFAHDLGSAVLAVATHRWAHPERIHWSSTARQLVHRAPYPVLVVPLHD